MNIVNEKLVVTGSKSTNSVGLGLWAKPAYENKRFGFEVTMYVFNR